MAQFISSINFKLDELIEGLENLNEKVEAALLINAKTEAAWAESYMKANRPWTDRTSRAKTSLRCQADKVDDGIRLTFSHGVWYGIWLELAHEKNWAIIQPTLNQQGQKMFDEITRFLLEE